MTTLMDWSAKRSGATITIRGLDQDTRQPKIVPNVDEIARLPSGTEAHLKDGSAIKLI